MTRPRPIAALPALHPIALLPTLGAPRAFPLSDPRTQPFYLGRGAVVRAVERLGLGGCEVLVPAYHHGVEVEALLAAGVRPRFYNVTRDFQTDFASLAAEVTPETRAIYVIHFVGLPQPMPEIVAFARARGLKIIEDCALALYSRDGRFPLGSRGDAAIFCFYKTLAVPHGGALWMPAPGPPPALSPPGVLATAHQILASLLTHLDRQGGTLGHLARRMLRKTARWWRLVGPLPVDSRPVGTRSFVPGQEKLGIAPASLRIAVRSEARSVVEARRRNYYALLSRLREVCPPMVQELPSGACPLFYPLWTEDKRALQQALAQEGIESIDFWREGSPLVPPGKFPDVEALRAHVLELPIHQDLDLGDIERIARTVKRALATRRPKARALAGE